MDAIFVGSDRQVFWDDALVDLKGTNAFHRLTAPVKKECCFLFDQPNETFSISYPCIVKDAVGYKM